jgi:hypothetical protein
MLIKKLILSLTTENKMKKIISLFFITACIIVISGCSSTVKVTTDYDKTVDFTKYKTFSFYKMKVTDNISQLNQERIIRSIKNEMVKKGFTQNDDAPDILVNATAILQDKQSISTNTYGYGGYYRPYGWGGGYGGASSINVYEYKDGSIIIDIINAASQKLIWQGIGNKEIDTPSKNPDVDIANAVAKIMYSFPPVEITKTNK